MSALHDTKSNANETMALLIYYNSYELFLKLATFKKFHPTLQRMYNLQYIYKKDKLLIVLRFSYNKCAREVILVNNLTFNKNALK